MYINDLPASYSNINHSIINVDDIQNFRFLCNSDGQRQRNFKKQGPVARSMVSVNQRLIPWQCIGFDTA